MDAAVNGRDALVVLPTGGGKSLCYQAPALLSDALTVVVSPLIALMKDQVDSLLEHNVPAAYFNSSLDADDRRRVTQGILDREYRLLFVAPERLANSHFMDVLSHAGVANIAIDEAHCISHWGHDFRADYRQLGYIKQRFPEASIQAFTATATPRVRDDIVAQLRLTDAELLVGDFFRPNLHYSVVRRQKRFDDVINAVLDRSGQPGIIYCIRRVDVDELTAQLRSHGVKVVGYHAGMADNERTRAQDAFSFGRSDVVVATIAFGMGIDRADVRYVIHAAMPKSLEHYQQESGRAGRDGAPAQCILYYTGGDFGLWKTLITNTNGGNCDEQLDLLSQIYQYCTGATCRHGRLVSYFGQTWERDCGDACDVCRGQVAALPESTEIAQKLLSCVYRTGQRFGARYVIDVLRGSQSERVIERSHDQLSVFGLLAEYATPTLMAWIDQLIDQRLLTRDGDYRVLTITSLGWEVLRGETSAAVYDVGEQRTRKPRKKTQAKRTRRQPSTPTVETNADIVTPNEAVDIELTRDDVDLGGAAALFEQLRQLRKDIAQERGLPAYVVFADKTLRALALAKPTTKVDMLTVKGVGPKKYQRYGDRFLNVIRSNTT